MALKVELQRSLTPEDMHAEEQCGICIVAFEVGSVRATLTNHTRLDLGVVCPECMDLLARAEARAKGSPGATDLEADADHPRPARRFPTSSSYEELLERYPEPIYPHEEAAEQAGR